MSDAKIVERIVAEARAKGEELLMQAQAQHDQDYGGKLARLEQDVVARRQRDRRRTEEAVQQQLSSRRLEERKKLLGLKRKLLDQAFEQAWEQRTTGAAYTAYLDKLLTATAQKGDQVIVSGLEFERFQGELKSVLDKHGVSLAPERGHFRAGFVVVSGDTRTNCSLDQEFRTLHEDTEIDAAHLMFGA